MLDCKSMVNVLYKMEYVGSVIYMYYRGWNMREEYDRSFIWDGIWGNNMIDVLY